MSVLDIEVAIHRGDLVIDRIVCVKCPAVAVLHYVFKWELQVFVWAECHGTHVFGTLDDFHVRAHRYLNRSTLFEEIRPLTDEWLIVMQREMTNSVAIARGMGSAPEILAEIERRSAFEQAIQRYRELVKEP